MKKVVYISKERGCVTPQMQAEHLRRHGHLEGIIDNVRYYTFNGDGYKVIYVGDLVAQVIKISEDECKRIVACSQLKYGGF